MAVKNASDKWTMAILGIIALGIIVYAAIGVAQGNAEEPRGNDMIVMECSDTWMPKPKSGSF